MCGDVTGSSAGAHLGNGVIHTGLDVVQTLQAIVAQRFRAPLEVVLAECVGCGHATHLSASLLC